MTARGGLATAWRARVPTYVPPTYQDSPALELSGFGSFPAIQPADFISHVTVAIAMYSTGASLGPPTWELWDAATEMIGGPQTGLGVHHPRQRGNRRLLRPHLHPARHPPGPRVRASGRRRRRFHRQRRRGHPDGHLHPRQ